MRDPAHLHERYTRAEEVAGSSDRAFGYVFAVIFAIVGFGRLMHGGAPRWWAVGVAATILAAAVVWTRSLCPFNRLWLKFGLLLHHVVNPIVMGFLFYLVIAPMGIVMRLAGRDLLKIRRDPAAATYWIERTPPGPEPASMKHQF